MVVPCSSPVRGVEASPSGTSPPWCPGRGCQAWKIAASESSTHPFGMKLMVWQTVNLAQCSITWAASGEELGAEEAPGGGSANSFVIHFVGDSLVKLSEENLVVQYFSLTVSVSSWSDSYNKVILGREKTTLIFSCPPFERWEFLGILSRIRMTLKSMSCLCNVPEKLGGKMFIKLVIGYALSHHTADFLYQ